MDYRSHYPSPLKYLSVAIDTFLVLGGTSVLLLIFSNAVLRGAAGFDLAWSLEATAFLLLWLTFLGCAAATARGANMRVLEIVQYALPKVAQYYLEIAINVVVALLLCSLIYYSYGISLHTWAQKTTVLYWPVGVLYAAMPTGMLITLVFHIYNAFLDTRRGVITDAQTTEVTQ